MLYERALERNAEERLGRYEDLKLVFASVMGDPEDAELRQALRDLPDMLRQAAGYKPVEPSRPKSSRRRPRSQMREALKRGDPIA